jgi:hypothetical protein
MVAGMKMRALSGLASVLSVSLFAALARHELINSKPYKITARPLAEALAALGPWLVAVIFATAVLVALAIHRRLIVFSPLVAVVAAGCVALAGFQATFALSIAQLSDYPIGGDFGLGTVASDFASFVRRESLRGLGIALAAVAGLALASGRLRRADEQIAQAEALRAPLSSEPLSPMSNTTDSQMLLLSLQRALLGEVHPQLRQASVEADGHGQIVRLRFEYDGVPADIVRESCSCAATEVIADFSSPWQLDEQHVSVPAPSRLSPLAHVAYHRAEPQHGA